MFQKIGMNSNATILYGHIESPEHIIDHMNRLRKLLSLLEKEKNWGVVGSSVILIHDNDKVVVKLIDLDHMVKKRIKIGTKIKYNKKLVEDLILNTNLGLSSLINHIMID